VPREGANKAITGPRIYVGSMLMAIAALHQVVGLAAGLGVDPNVKFAGKSPPGAMWQDGLVASVGLDPWRLTTTWFLLFGFALAHIGLLAREVEKLRTTLPTAFPIGLAALCTIGVLFMPASGFWLGFIPAAVALRRALRVRSDVSESR
jgi:hypothetical protein